MNSTFTKTGVRIGKILILVLYTGWLQAQNISIGNGETITINVNTQYTSLVVKNGGKLIINPGFTLTVGASGTPATTTKVDFQNGSEVIIHETGKLVVNGKFVNSNNSDQITVNGAMQVNGNVSTGSNSKITGTGVFDATGIIDNSGLIFGSNCGFVNNLTNSTPTICQGATATLAGSTSTSATYKWEVSTVSVSSGFANAPGTYTNFNYSGTVNQTSWFKRTMTKSGCTIVATTQVIVNPSGTWIGNNGNWNVSTNWCGGIPTLSTDLNINTGKVTLSSTVAARNINIGSGATLEMNTGSALNVYGKWVNNGTVTINDGIVSFTNSSVAQTIAGTNAFKNLTINNPQGVTISSGAQTINGTLTLTAGSLKTNNLLKLNFDNGAAIAGTGTGNILDNITVQRSISKGWHYLGGSLNGLTYNEIANNVSLASFYTYKENSASKNMQDGWVMRREASSTTLEGQKDDGGPSSMIGYALEMPNAAVIDYTGTYTHGKQYSTGLLSFVSSGDINADGWHLVSNPYPSFVKWTSSGVLRDGISSSMYYYNSAAGKNVAYMGGTYPESLNECTEYIPPMQAFWIKTTKNNAQLTFTKDAIEIPSVKPSFYRKAASELISLKLITHGNGSSDETVLRFVSEATEGFDEELDLIKFKNEGNTPSLYTIDHSTEYAINTMPEFVLDQKYHLNFEAYTAGEHSISIKNMTNVPDGVSLILEDKQLHVIHNFSMEPEYKFSAGVLDNPSRFNIYFEQDEITSTVENVTPADIDIVSYQHHVNVHFHNHASTKADIFVLNMAGHEVQRMHHADISNHILDFKLHHHIHSGTYIVKVVTAEASHSEKVTIH